VRTVLVLVAGVAASAVVGLHGAIGSGTTACAPLRLGPGSAWSEKTGQHSASFVVTNASAARCTFTGYPRIELLGRRGRALRFTYHDGGDQMITARPPRRIVARPGGRVYFAINKYRCDLRSQALARVIRVQLPGSTAWLRLGLPSWIGLEFCGSGPPSGIVSVSPIVRFPRDAAAGP
jgi:uncharacterized protein DUF4232